MQWVLQYDLNNQLVILEIFFKTFIKSKLKPLIFAGYSLLQCNKAYLTFNFSKTFTDLSIDLSSFIPVLKIIGFLNEQICSKSGMLLHSPEPILNALIPSLFNLIAELRENGVLR